MIHYETHMSQRDTKNDENVIASRRRSNLKSEIPRGVHPEQKNEILRSAQNDMRRARNDREGVFSGETSLQRIVSFISWHIPHLFFHTPV